MNDHFERLLDETEKRYASREFKRIELSTKSHFGPLTAEAPERAAARAVRLTNRLTEARLRGGAASELADLGLERILGADDLISVSFLEGGLTAARSVVRLKVKSPGGALLGYGTGFMISPRILLTNEHVFSTAAEAAPSAAEFDFRDSLLGSVVPREFALEPHRFFLSNSALDCALVAVAPISRSGGVPLGQYGWNRLIEEEGKVAIGEKLNIIQHPGGQPQQIALRSNELKDVLDLHLHYETDTAPGSSGSPVFNDQWEVVALHHSGVPKRDSQNRILADDNTPWRRELGEHRISWISNEGVRISRILAWARAAIVPAAWRELLSEVFSSTVPPASFLSVPTTSSAPLPPVRSEPELAMNSTATITVPLNITFSLGGATPPLAVSSNLGPIPTPGSSSKPAKVASNPPLQADFAKALAQLRGAEAQTYFDAVRDQTERTTYYAGVEWSEEPPKLFSALSKLLRDTHRTKPSYRPMTEVYPWVDLHPDGKIRSIYSGTSYDAEEFLRLDLEVESYRQARLTELLTREVTSPEALASELSLLEDALPYNCEHVVPQSWFGKREPMKGDLHHLFACETNCNSFRSNIPYFDFSPGEEATRNECGRRETGKFEPEAGHGAVARATLYFLLRYPGLIGDEQRELAADRLPILLRWHHENAPDEYERHRNQAIFARQGNRNPLIDFPQHAERINFVAGFGG